MTKGWRSSHHSGIHSHRRRHHHVRIHHHLRHSRNSSHHTLPRWWCKGVGGWDGYPLWWGLCKGILDNFPSLESCCCGINETLCLLLHPLLVVEFHIVLVFTSRAVSLSYAGGIVREVRVTIVAIVLWHCLFFRENSRKLNFPPRDVNKNTQSSSSSLELSTCAFSASGYFMK